MIQRASYPCSGDVVILAHKFAWNSKRIKHTSNVTFGNKYFFVKIKSYLLSGSANLKNASYITQILT